MRKRILSVVLGLVFASGAAACEPPDAFKSDAEKKREEARKSEFTDAQKQQLCTGGAMTGKVKLPADFPTPDGVTYVQQRTNGPSQVVDGRIDNDIDDAYDAYQNAVKAAGYDVLFDEKEADDAEISYKGGGTTGQIALRADCGGEKPLIVHITNRPE